MIFTQEQLNRLIPGSLVRTPLGECEISGWFPPHTHYFIMKTSEMDSLHWGVVQANISVDAPFNTNCIVEVLRYGPEPRILKHPNDLLRKALPALRHAYKAGVNLTEDDLGLYRSVLAVTKGTEEGNA